jgi:hypothetical protein
MYTFQNPPKTLAEAITARIFTPALLLELGTAVVGACSALRYVVTGRETSLDVPAGFEQCGSFMAAGPDNDAYTISPFLSEEKKAPHYLVVQNLRNGQRIGVFTALVDKARIKAERAARAAKWAIEDAQEQLELATVLGPDETIGAQFDGTRPHEVVGDSHYPTTFHPKGLDPGLNPYWMYHQPTPVRFNAHQIEDRYDLVLYQGRFWEINSPTSPAQR